MFVDAIEKTSRYTRPVHSIMRTYGGKKIIPGAATLFFVNEEGYAVTCKHVAELLAKSEAINTHYNNFRNELNKLPKDGKFKMHLKGLELKYKYTAETIIQIKNSFVDCVSPLSGFSWFNHPDFDLSIIKFNDYTNRHYTDFAIFKKDITAIKQGEFLCRLGYPFPEFTNFIYNETTDDIEWTATGNNGSPRFPIEGMVTRFLMEKNGLYGIELSTPGLKGQSGGPLFDKQGIVCGMQFSTKHLHLGFDLVDKEIFIDNKSKKVTDYSFIHLGQCIDAAVIKKFLTDNQVKFYEE